MANVICPGCRGRFHELTDRYTNDTPAHGGMFRLKEPYRGNGWNSFPELDSTPWGALECPECNTPYANGQGRVLVDGEIPVDREAEKISTLHAEGKTPAEIAKETGLHHKAVAKRLKDMGLTQ